MHLAMAEEDKVRRGMSPEQARREARLELGGAAQVREAAPAARGLPWLETFWLDARLGLRMLRRSWGLTLVGGLAMAVTIGLGASMFTIWDTFAGTRLPLDEGDRVVAIQPFDRAAQRVDRATPLPDFRRWRETLTSVEHVSAMRPIAPGGDRTRRRRRFCGRGGDDRRRLPARARPATAGTTTDGRRRARGRRTGRRDRLSALARGVFLRPRRPRTTHPQSPRTPHSSRATACGVPVSGQPAPLDSALAANLFLGAASRILRRLRLCATRSWSDAGTRAR